MLCAASIVSASVVLVALTYFGARAAGWHPQLGTYSESLSAAFTALAAVAALYIATRDRQERSRERLAADEAQAKLVMITPAYDTGDYDPYPAPKYQMAYKNHGEHPILDVRLARIEMRAYPLAVAELPDFIDRIVEAGGHSRGVGAKFTDEHGDPFPKPISEPDSMRSYREWPDDERDLKILGWVTFSDINGNRWAKSSDHRLHRLRSDEDVFKIR